MEALTGFIERVLQDPADEAAIKEIVALSQDAKNRNDMIRASNLLPALVTVTSIANDDSSIDAKLHAVRSVFNLTVNSKERSTAAVECPGLLTSIVSLVCTAVAVAVAIAIC
jgi:hypothetical protein